METDELRILRQENVHLKTELAAQQAVCQKLKNERDQYFDAFQDAQEEIR